MLIAIEEYSVWVYNRLLFRSGLLPLNLGQQLFLPFSNLTVINLTRLFLCVIKLPVKIDIIKHPNETDGKSTAIHAKILAPDDVDIYTYPCIPDFETDKVGITLYSL